MDKGKIIKLILDKTDKRLEELEESLVEIQERINEAPKSTESASDTTRYQLDQTKKNFEQVRQRTVEFASSLKGIDVRKSCDKGEIGSVMELKSGKKSFVIILLPSGEIPTIKVGGLPVKIISAAAPLGKALLGKRAGNEIEIKTALGNKIFLIRLIE